MYTSLLRADCMALQRVRVSSLAVSLSTFTMCTRHHCITLAMSTWTVDYTLDWIFFLLNTAEDYFQSHMYVHAQQIEGCGLRD